MADIVPTTYTVYPDGYHADWLPSDKHMWTLTIEYRGHAGYPGTDPERRWAVCRLGSAWTTDEGWAYEPQPSSRDKAWFDRARFTLDQARDIAWRELPRLTINGRTFEQLSNIWKARGDA